MAHPNQHGPRAVEARRAVEPSLLLEWEETESELVEMLDRLGAVPSLVSSDVFVIPLEITNEAEIQERVGRIKTPGAYVTARSSAGLRAHAIPTSRRTSSSGDMVSAIYIETHTRLLAWWLTCAWRTRQLSRATASLADAGEVIAAASCARSLLETAAAAWHDSLRIADLWQTAKNTRPVLDDETFGAHRAITELLNEIQYGAKFDHRAPEPAALWGAQRTNVQTAVERLAKRTSGDLATEYQWLCNSVHPSVGTTLAFSSAPLENQGNTHFRRFVSGRPIAVDVDLRYNEEHFQKWTVPSVLGRSTVASNRVLRATLDSALRVIDDVGLTTGAPLFADFDY